MNAPIGRHERFLELAAAGIDFELSPLETRELSSHLAGCTSCRRTTNALHADAQTIERLRSVHVHVPASAGRLRPSSAARPAVAMLRVFAVAAALGLLAVSAAVVGSELLQQDAPSTSSPAPSA